MGFGSLATYVILFAVGLSVIVGFILTFRDYFVRSSISLEARQSIERQQAESGIEIINFTYNQTNVASDSYRVDTQAEFETGVSENISTTTTPGELHLNGTNLTGVWYSEIIDTNYSVDFHTIESGANYGAQEDIYLQLRSAESTSNLTGQFLGPDGTSATVYQADNIDAINSIHDVDREFQVQVYIERLVNFIDPELDFIEINYTPYNLLELHIKNDGKIQLDKDKIDYFLSGDRIDRASVYSSNITSSTDIINPRIWDPDKIIRVLVSKNIEPDNYVITATNEYSSKDQLMISI